MTRVIAGEFKGRRLRVPADGVRPTSDRVREAIFSSLASKTDLHNARVLDLYAGTGALGIEAMSRRAAFAAFVESDRNTSAITEKNLTALGLADTTAVITDDVLRWTSQSSQLNPNQQVRERGFDLAFIDPPYEFLTVEVGLLLEQLLEHRWLGPEATVVIERSTKSEPIDWPGRFVQTSSRSYGDTTIWYGQIRD